MRKIIHVDMDAFFAAIEQKRHPRYRGKPVVVGGSGDPIQRGVVSAASYEARKYGVHSAQPLRIAYRLCPHAIFLPVDIEKYAEVSDKVMQILERYTDLLEVMGLDEAYLDVTRAELPAVEIATRIKKEIRENLGLTASVGVGPNKLVAKIASDFSKPNGLTSIPRGRVRDFLRPLPVAKLWGVGKKTEHRLAEMGINTIGELADTPIENLVEEFGAGWAETLHEFALGKDTSPVEPYHEPKSVSRQVTYQVDTTNLTLLKKTIYEMAEDLAEELKEIKYKGRTVEVKIRYSNFFTTTRSKTLPEPISNPKEIYEHALSLLPKFDLTRKVRMVGVGVSNLLK